MKLLYDTALSFLGKPYLYGHESPIDGDGFDCSGLVGELLLSVGAHPQPGVRLTAQGLYDHFSVFPHHELLDLSGSLPATELGSLLFYGTPKHVVHVAMALSPCRMIEAGHGGPLIDTVPEAIQNGSFVRIRPIRKGPGFLGSYMPVYLEVMLK